MDQVEVVPKDNTTRNIIIGVLVVVAIIAAIVGIVFAMKASKKKDQCAAVDTKDKCIDNNAAKTAAKCNPTDGTLSCTGTSDCLIANKPTTCTATQTATCKSDHTWTCTDNNPITPTTGWKHMCNGKTVSTDAVRQCIESGKMPICTKENGYNCTETDLSIAKAKAIANAQEEKTMRECPLNNLLWYTFAADTNISGSNPFGDSPRLMSQSNMTPSKPIDITNHYVYFPNATTEKYYLFMLYYYGDSSLVHGPQINVSAGCGIDPSIWRESNQVFTPSTDLNSTTYSFHAVYIVPANQPDAYVEIHIDQRTSFPLNCFGDCKIIEIPTTIVFTSDPDAHVISC